jgi:hypothetical protein
MYDPEAINSPHLSGAQPTWGDLPYACEILNAHWEAADESPEEVSERLASEGHRNKVNQLMTLLGPEKLRLITERGTLSPQGMWLARDYEEADQQGLDGEPGLGAKRTLSQTEQSFFGQLLFERNWVPMLATVNLLATTTVADTETDARAEGFRDRIDHLEGYQNVESINSWKKKAQAHLSWALHLDLAYENSRRELELTGFGHQVHESVRPDYHPDWPY